MGVLKREKRVQAGSLSEGGLSVVQRQGLGGSGRGISIEYSSGFQVCAFWLPISADGLALGWGH